MQRSFFFFLTKTHTFIFFLSHFLPADHFRCHILRLQKRDEDVTSSSAAFTHQIYYLLTFNTSIILPQLLTLKVDLFCFYIALDTSKTNQPKSLLTLQNSLDSSYSNMLKAQTVTFLPPSNRLHATKLQLCFSNEAKYSARPDQPQIRETFLQ